MKLSILALGRGSKVDAHPIDDEGRGTAWSRSSGFVSVRRAQGRRNADVPCIVTSPCSAGRLVESRISFGTGQGVRPATVNTPGRHVRGMLRSFDGIEPDVHESAYVDPAAVVIGDVTQIGRASCRERV